MLPAIVTGRALVQCGLVSVVAARRRNLDFSGMLGALKVGREVCTIDASGEVLDMCHDLKIQPVAHPVQKHIAVNQQFIMVLNVLMRRMIA